MKTDEELVVLAQNGDNDSEIELFSRYKNVLRKISRSYFLIGGDIEDILQEGMLGLYKAIKSYSPSKGVSFSSFANLCIKRQIQTAVRRASSQKSLILSTAFPITGNLEQDEDEEDEVIIPSFEQTPEERIISRETIKEMKKQIKSKLSQMELEVFSKYLDGKTYKEISLETGLTFKSIDNALTRIKKKLEFLKNI